MHPTLGILARFQAFFHAAAFFQSDGVPPPAPARVTQTVSPLIAKKQKQMIRTLTPKRKVAVLLLICVLFVIYSIMNAIPKPILPDDVFAFNPIPQNGKSEGVEGVYYHRASSLIEILDELTCKVDGWDDCTTYQLLRFYDDGFVLETPIGTDDGIRNGDLPKLQEWFNRETKKLPNGKYFISGSRLWFSTSVHYDDDNRTVTSDFSGVMIGNILILDGYSHYNGHRSSKMIFIKLHGNPEE